MQYNRNEDCCVKRLKCFLIFDFMPKKQNNGLLQFLYLISSFQGTTYKIGIDAYTNKMHKRYKLQKSSMTFNKQSTVLVFPDHCMLLHFETYIYFAIDPTHLGYWGPHLDWDAGAENHETLSRDPLVPNVLRQ